MRPLSPFIADQVTQMLAMRPSKLAKRLKCTANNADKAQKLIVLILVKNYRWAQGIDATELEEQGKGIAASMARAQEGELAAVFKTLMAASQRAGQPA